MAKVEHLTHSDQEALKKEEESDSSYSENSEQVEQTMEEGKGVSEEGIKGIKLEVPEREDNENIVKSS